MKWHLQIYPRLKGKKSKEYEENVLFFFPSTKRKLEVLVTYYITVYIYFISNSCSHHMHCFSWIINAQLTDQLLISQPLQYLILLKGGLEKYYYLSITVRQN